MGTKATHRQRRNLASLLLAYGYQNLFRDWESVTKQDQEMSDLPNVDIARDIAEKWLGQIIHLASKAKEDVAQEAVFEVPSFLAEVKNYMIAD